MSESQKLNFEDWLELAQKNGLSESEYQSLISSLPSDKTERQNWLNELSVAMALSESNKNHLEWLKNVLQELQGRKKKSPLWPKALAAAAVGALILTMVLPKGSDYNEMSEELAMTSRADRKVSEKILNNTELGTKETLKVVSQQFGKDIVASSENAPKVSKDQLLALDEMKEDLDKMESAPIKVAPMEEMVALNEITLRTGDGMTAASSRADSVKNKLNMPLASVMAKAVVVEENELLQDAPLQAAGQMMASAKPEKTVALSEFQAEDMSEPKFSVEQLEEISDVASESKPKADSGTFTIRTPTAIAGVLGSHGEIVVGDKLKESDSRSRRSTGLRQLEIKGNISAEHQTVASHQLMAKVSLLAPQQEPSTIGEQYQSIPENEFIQTTVDPQSTFSIDVDTASYSNVRRIIRSGQLPPTDAIRVEEMINYFDYDYPQAKPNEPFSVTMDVGACPWNKDNRLLRVGLKGRVDLERPKVNLVFLLDVSGSMNQPNKLPLLKQSLNLLLNSLNDDDSVAIVAYAGHTGIVLDPTLANQKDKIKDAMQKLVAQGGTNGAGGIQLAYQLAEQSYVKGSVNRVVLATDGDFNVGISNREELKNFIAEKRKSGVELSVLGFGTGNIHDDVMETLANTGNGNYSYIDTLREARKALVGELNSTLVTIAKDVKIQMQFNPNTVKSFRLVGYENRKLAHQDFNDDRKDAGEMGMGHTVTALYEIVPVENADADEALAELRLRYKKPQTDSSLLLTYQQMWSNEFSTNVDFQWAAVTASWGQWLKHSAYAKDIKIDELLKLAKANRGEDSNGYRAEMIQLMEQSMDLQGTGNSSLPRWEFRK